MRTPRLNRRGRRSLPYLTISLLVALWGAVLFVLAAAFEPVRGLLLTALGVTTICGLTFGSVRAVQWAWDEIRRQRGW